jgi:hypothetical protein
LGNSFPAALVETGQWDNDVLVFRAEFSMGATKLALRNATKFLDGGRLTSDEFSSANGSPETLFVHVEAIKNKSQSKTTMSLSRAEVPKPA